MSSERIAIVGASSGVGRALAEVLAERGHALLLVASDARDLEAVATDLRLRFSGTVLTHALDLRRSGPERAGAVAAWEERLGPLDALLLPLGSVDPRDDAIATADLLDATTQVNMIAVIELAAAAALRMKERGKGTLVAFTSIAAAVPRRRNMVYAASKAGLETWLAALRHHLCGTGVRVQGYALGYVDTAMTHGLKLLFPRASPRAVATRVADRLHKDLGIVSFPRYWWLVTRVLRILPWWIYRRLRF